MRGPGPQGRTARILVAEDNPTNRIVILAQLGKLGYQPTAVTNGAEAVAAVKGGGYDLVFMDCQMPVMDGFEATRHIRDLTEIPIVAMTADAMPADRDRCLDEGMDDYLAKPVKLNLLSDDTCEVAAGMMAGADYLKWTATAEGETSRRSMPWPSSNGLPMTASGYMGIRKF